MSEFLGKIYVRVKTFDMWKKISPLWISDDFSDHFLDISDTPDNYLVLEEVCIDEIGLEQCVKDISSKLKRNCIIIGMCADYDSEYDYTHLVYYLGSGVKAKCFKYNYDDDNSDDKYNDDEFVANRGYGQMWGMMNNVNIYDLIDCLNYYSNYGPGFTKAEINHLNSFGIVMVNNESGTVFEEDIPDLGLPYTIDLVETQYEGRIPKIEKIVVGDTVKLVREPNNEYDPNAIDIQNSEGSIGYLDPDISEILAPLLDNNRITYSANIANVTPLSKRPKYCKTPLVSVHIETKRKM